MHTVAEVVENAAALGATPGRQETADDAGDVLLNVELPGFIHASALHTQAETPDAWEHDGMPVGQFLLEQILQFCDHGNDGAFRQMTVPARLFRNLAERYFALAHGLCKIFTVGAAALDVVLDKFNVYCHDCCFFCSSVTFVLNYLNASLLHGVTLVP